MSDEVSYGIFKEDSSMFEIIVYTIHAMLHKYGPEKVDF